MIADNININDYNYNLPNDRIAKYPLDSRELSKLLIYNSGEIYHKKFYNLPDVLSKKDLIVFNTTKVIQARLTFRKPTGAKIEIFCLEPYEPSDYEQIFQETKRCKWYCAIGNFKKWKSEKIVSEFKAGDKSFILTAKKIKSENNNHIIEFFWDNEKISFADILENAGVTPIPPYLKRESEEADKIRYQTVYSKQKGSVAAPTAGLHFTEELISKIKSKGVNISELILHVGAGTFKPVKSDFVSEHKMHTEHFTVSKKLIKDLIENKNVVSVGTTSVRTLESLYWMGVKLQNNKQMNNFHISQWEVYDIPGNLSVKKSLKNISEYLEREKKSSLEASTQIIIVPGYEFKIVKKLITNFHQPKSTLLLLIAAFIGEKWKNIYEYALKNDFRFLSYGDSSILIP